jgi:hypothetical protein
MRINVDGVSFLFSIESIRANYPRENRDGFVSEMNTLNNGLLKDSRFKKEVLNRVWEEAYPKSEETANDEPVKDGGE